MQKYKFDVTWPDVLFMETALVPPEHDKQWVDVSRPRGTRMHYVTHRYHRIQKCKFSVTCPIALFLESILIPTEHENSASTFHAPDAQECTT
jgi:hypothetical protein